MTPLRVVAAVWIRQRRLFAALRGPGRARAGLWELPGGKVDRGEPDANALVRELREELGLEARVGAWVAESEWRYPDLTVHLVAYVVHADGEPTPNEHVETRWLAVDELDRVAWAPADVPLLPAVAALLRESERSR